MSVGFPFKDEFVDRNMVPLKFYYDLGEFKHINVKEDNKLLSVSRGNQNI